MRSLLQSRCLIRNPVGRVERSVTRQRAAGGRTAGYAALHPPYKDWRLRGGRWRVLAAHDRRGIEDGADDFVVTGAAAKIAGEPVARFFLGRVLVFVEQRLRRDDKARCAEAALQGGVLQEFLLHRMQRLTLGDALDRQDRAALGLDAEHQAGTHDIAVDDDRAGAAIARAAAFLAARQVQFVAQAVEQCLLRLAEEFHRLAIDDAGYVMLAHSLVSQIRLQARDRSEEHTSELQSPYDLVCRLLLEKKNKH